MAFFLFQSYDLTQSTARYRLIQGIVDLIGILVSFGSFGLVYAFLVKFILFLSHEILNY